MVKFGHEDTIVRRTPLESYPLWSEKEISNDVRLCMPCRTAEIDSGVKSRSCMGSGNETVWRVFARADGGRVLGGWFWVAWC